MFISLFIADDADTKQHLVRALRQLLRYRPDDPMQFLANYFMHVAVGVAAVQRAYKLLKYVETKPWPVRQESIAEAYTILSVNQQHTLDRPYGSLRARGRHSIGDEGVISRKSGETPLSPPRLKNIAQNMTHFTKDSGGMDGVLGHDFMQLLGMITSDFSPQVSEALCTRFVRHDQSLVNWKHFLSSLVICMQYQDLLRYGRQLFLYFDPLNTGLARERDCQDVIDFLLHPASTSRQDIADMDERLSAAMISAQKRISTQYTEGEMTLALYSRQEEDVVPLASFLRILSLLFLELSSPSHSSIKS
eukprot:gene9900-2085_t